MNEETLNSISSAIEVDESASSVPPPLPETIVEVRNLKRAFAGVQAVNDLTFSLFKGQVIGFIGANGAGKTTTMRIIAGLEQQDAGSVLIHGVDTTEFPEKTKRWIGWMPDHYGTYPHMTVVEYLDFFARAYGLKGKEREERLEEVMAFADLLELADRPMNALSKGMGQRLCFGRMLIPDPEVLILDEPAAGLDPKARIEFKNLIRQLQRRGKTIFISSHILSELAEMCDTILFIDGGKLVYHGSAETLQHRNVLSDQLSDVVSATYQISILGDTKELHRWIESHPNWQLLEEMRDGARVELREFDLARAAEGLRQMVTAGLKVTQFQREMRKLEDAFVDILTKR